MNYSTAIFLINNSVRAVLCTYEADDPLKKAPREMFKTLDQKLRVGDFVVVPTNTRHMMTVVKVVEVDVDPDFDSASQVRWIVHKVDRHEFERLSMQEEDAITAVKSAERTKKRNELRAAMIADNMEVIKGLPITQLNGDSLPPPQEPLT